MERITFRVPEPAKKAFHVLCVAANTNMQAVLRAYVEAAVRKKQP